MSHRQRRPRRYGTGLLLGALAYALGFVLTGVLVAMDDYTTWMREHGLEASLLEFTGVVFYNAHLVPVNSGVRLFGAGINVFDAAPPELPALLFQAVPTSVLFFVGYVAVYRKVRAAASVDVAVAYAATIVYGYVVLSLAGAFVVAPAVDSIVMSSVSPDLGTAVVLMGVIYPLISGVAGGVAALAVLRAQSRLPARYGGLSTRR